MVKRPISNKDLWIIRKSYAVNFERFTTGRLSYIPEIVKLRESPGKAGGLPRKIYYLSPLLTPLQGLPL
jgi:hypothetical protein